MEADRTNTSSGGVCVCLQPSGRSSTFKLSCAAAELSANVGRFIFCAARTHPAQNGQLKQTQQQHKAFLFIPLYVPFINGTQSTFFCCFPFLLVPAVVVTRLNKIATCYLSTSENPCLLFEQNKNHCLHIQILVPQK
jgi:hypothetical protein